MTLRSHCRPRLPALCGAVTVSLTSVCVPLPALQAGEAADRASGADSPAPPKLEPQEPLTAPLSLDSVDERQRPELSPEGAPPDPDQVSHDPDPDQVSPDPDPDPGQSRPGSVPTLAQWPISPKINRRL